MRITPAAHIEKMSGAHGTVVFVRRKTGVTFGLKRNTEVRRSTGEQRVVQKFLKEAAQNWKTLSALQRQAWTDYGKQYFTKDNLGRKVTVQGLATYVRANFHRQLLGLPMTTAAPTLPPPPSILTVEQVSAQNPDSVGLTVMHTIANVAGLSLLVRMTAKGSSVADNPADNSYYLVRGVTPNSASPLQASGSDVIFAPTKFVVNDGERYGVEVRVLRNADGLVSDPMYGDFQKLI